MAADMHPFSTRCLTFESLNKTDSYCSVSWPSLLDWITRFVMILLFLPLTSYPFPHKSLLRSWARWDNTAVYIGAWLPISIRRSVSVVAPGFCPDRPRYSLSKISLIAGFHSTTTRAIRSRVWYRQSSAVPFAHQNRLCVIGSFSHIAVIFRPTVQTI